MFKKFYFLNCPDSTGFSTQKSTASAAERQKGPNVSLEDMIMNGVT